MKKYLLLFLCVLQLIHCDEEAKVVYGKIKDIRHPTLLDYYLIQNYLTHGKREGLENLKDTEKRQRDFKLIGKFPEEMPKEGLIPVNCKPDDRENCLVLYASFNLHYPDGLKRLIKLISESDFKGHILYHLGGWPDLEGGSLVLAHVPHAFKACCFKEAQRLGFKRLLWLDVSIVPVVSLNTIFQMIAKKGYFTIGNYHSIKEYCNPETAAYFGYTLEETNKLLSCQSGFIGVDLTTDNGKKVVDLFYRAAQDKHGYFSARSDQTALSLILHRLQLLDFPDLTKVAPLKSMVREQTLFIVDRPYVQYE